MIPFQRSALKMAAFRRVEATQAGPTALGILIPPSRRTFLILRPRSLSFDFLCVQRPDATRFRELAHDEAAAAAHQLYAGLREWAEGGTGSIEVVARPADSGLWLRVHVGPLYLIACARQPGKPYEPLIFADVAEAEKAETQAAALLCPGAGTEQELYFNTRHFSMTIDDA
jgi:hypothetical protein